MQVNSCKIQDLLIIKLDVHGDKRGFFVERFNQENFQKAGLPVNFVQDNHSRSAPNVLRGLHYQHSPAQGKLVGVVRGKIWDVAVDIRHDSPSFGQYHAVEISAENGVLFWIPSGFAHGFCVLGDEPADIIYKVTANYNPAGEGGIKYNDKNLNIDWPIKNPTISERDKNLPDFSEIYLNIK